MFIVYCHNDVKPQHNDVKSQHIKPQHNDIKPQHNNIKPLHNDIKPNAKRPFKVYVYIYLTRAKTAMWSKVGVTSNAMVNIGII